MAAARRTGRRFVSEIVLPRDPGVGAADPRRQQLRDWARAVLGDPAAALRPLAGDASFRRYFRVHATAGTWAAMDAPPEREPLGPYLAATGLLAQAGVHVPAIRARDAARGFLLLEDLGDAQYLERLTPSAADGLYADALAALVRIQTLPRSGLPPYDEALLQYELDLFSEWYLGRHLGLELSAAERELLRTAERLLIERALAQPRVVVHRDYHSRNLMVAAPNPGVLDHQDAVWGPVSYDLVSLLRDCYVAWPEARVRGWVGAYRTRARAAGVLDAAVGQARLLEWCDWTGVQRHLKAAGIFARLCHRDGKPGYLADVPRTLAHARAECARVPELAAFGAFLERLPPP